MTIKTTPPRSRQKGFTLIEIVMVLVLLGILAAVAVPKYFDLQEEANKAVAKTVEQELQARLDGEFAKAMLEGQSCKGFHITSTLFGGGKETSSNPEIAAVLADQFNKSSTRAKLYVEGFSPTGVEGPLKISLDGGADGYPYSGMLYFPKCSGE